MERRDASFIEELSNEREGHLLLFKGKPFIDCEVLCDKIVVSPFLGMRCCFYKAYAYLRGRNADLHVSTLWSDNRVYLRIGDYVVPPDLIKFDVAPDRVEVFEDYEVKGKFILSRITDRSLPLVIEEWYLFGGCFYRFKVYRYGSAIRDKEGVRYEISYHFHVVERLGSKVKI